MGFIFLDKLFCVETSYFTPSSSGPYGLTIEYIKKETRLELSLQFDVGLKLDISRVEYIQVGENGCFKGIYITKFEDNKWVLKSIKPSDETLKSIKIVHLVGKINDRDIDYQIVIMPKDMRKE